MQMLYLGFENLFTALTRKPKILVCPLDWGIGHATRCVPVIRELIRQNAEVIIGASNRPLAFLREEFPDLTWIDFPGYSISYPRTRKGMALKMLKQMPSMLQSVRKEYALLHQIIDTYQIEGVISDNRFGLYSNRIPAVFITHQVFIKIPSSIKFMEPLIRRINHRYINKFNECWIPDVKEDLNLSGALSHKKPLSPNFHFIGALSRFQDKGFHALNTSKTEKKYDALIILSGPEPQRSIFEEIIRLEIESYNGPIAVVLGKPESDMEAEEINSSIVFPHLDSQKLLELNHSSGMIIARSGYSTIMDLAATGKKAVVIPTPGQTEQEYLAEHLQRMGVFTSIPQAQFKLKKAILAGSQLNDFRIKKDHNSLNSRVANFLQMIS